MREYFQINKIIELEKKHRILTRIFIYLFGVFIMSNGILMIVGAGVGLSGPDAYITSIVRGIKKDPQSEWYGYLIWIHYIILWIFIVIINLSKKIMKKNRIRRKDILYLLSMLGPVFFTGPLVSANSFWILPILQNVNVLYGKYLIFISGFFIAAFGGACTIWTNFFIEPHSGMVLEIVSIVSKKYKKIKFSHVRIFLDIIFLILAITIGFSTKQFVFGFNPQEFTTNVYPLISYSTLMFIFMNGFVFGMSLKILNKVLKENKK